MPGLPQAPQGAGGAGLIALEEDGGAAGALGKGVSAVREKSKHKGQQPQNKLNASLLASEEGVS